MNQEIMLQAIARVKQIVRPPELLCGICHKNKIAYREDNTIEVKGIPTKVGLPTCKSCFDNLQIAVGEISIEY